MNKDFFTGAVMDADKIVEAQAHAALKDANNKANWNAWIPSLAAIEIQEHSPMCMPKQMWEIRSHLKK